MKHFAMILMLCLAALVAMAQGDIQFTVQPPSQEDLPASVADALELKVKQIVTRNKAASSNPHNVFGIEAEVTIDDTYTSAGLLDEVSFAKGTLTLIMVNTVDGSLYHSEEFEVMGDASGDEVKALKAMVTGIKTKDPLFTRFIRVGRERIEDYYAKNCPYILSKAQNLIDTGREEEAMSYLSAISETLPCFEQAAELMKQLHGYILDETPDTVVMERTVIVEKPVPVPVPVEPTPSPVPTPAPVPTPVPAPMPEPEPDNAPIDCDITISIPDFDCKVLACQGNETQKRIAITVEMVNKNPDRNIYEWSSLRSVIDNKGREMKSFGHDGDQSIKMPPYVKVQRTFYVKNVYERIPSFSYVEFTTNAIVTIRNLKVNW